MNENEYPEKLIGKEITFSCKLSFLCDKNISIAAVNVGYENMCTKNMACVFLFGRCDFLHALNYFLSIAWEFHSCYEYFSITLPSVKTCFTWGHMGLVPDLSGSLSGEGQQNPFGYGFHSSSCAPFLHILLFSDFFPCSSLYRMHGHPGSVEELTCLQEEGNFDWTQKCPSGSCAGASNSCSGGTQIG